MGNAKVKYIIPSIYRLCIDFGLITEYDFVYPSPKWELRTRKYTDRQCNIQTHAIKERCLIDLEFEW